MVTMFGGCTAIVFKGVSFWYLILDPEVIMSYSIKGVHIIVVLDKTHVYLKSRT